MNETIRLRSRKADVAALVVSLAVIAAGSTAVRAAVGASDRSPVVSATTTSATHGPAARVTTHAVGRERVELVVDGHIATATLADIPAAHQFAAMLPVELDMHDPFGQAKSGALPRALDVGDAARVFDPATGGVYYWPDGGDLAVFYDDLGQRVPPPGLVRLGVVDSGLGAIASASNRVTVRIELLDRTSP
jgi:hypothetical protein